MSLWVDPSLTVGGRLSVILPVCSLAGSGILLLHLLPSRWKMGILLLAIGRMILVRLPLSGAYITEPIREDDRSSILGIYLYSAP
jgi:hypothetical protein